MHAISHVGPDFFSYLSAQVVKTLYIAARCLREAMKLKRKCRKHHRNAVFRCGRSLDLRTQRKQHCLHDTARPQYNEQELRVILYLLSLLSALSEQASPNSAPDHLQTFLPDSSRAPLSPDPLRALSEAFFFVDVWPFGGFQAHALRTPSSPVAGPSQDPHRRTLSEPSPNPPRPLRGLSRGLSQSFVSSLVHFFVRPALFRICSSVVHCFACFRPSRIVCCVLHCFVFCSS